MIKLFKILLKAMIEVGSTIITAITIGSTAPTKIDWGSDKVWPETTPPPSDYINLGSNSASVGSGVTSGTISVTASSNSWTVVSNNSWLSVSKTNNSRATYTVQSNGTISPRTGTLSFKIGSTTYATFTVSQAAGEAYIRVNPETLSGLTDSASAGTITVTTNLSSWGVWIVYRQPDNDWVTASKQGSTGVSWSVTENTTGAYRQAQIEISGGGISKTVAVRQTAGYVWSISPTGATVSSAAGYTQLTVNSSYHNEALEVLDSVATNTMNASMSLISSGSAGYFVYNITYPQRTVSSQGTFVAVFRQSGTNQTLTYVLTQLPGEQQEYVSISPSVINGVSSAGTSTSISVTASTTSWTASTSDSWITIAKAASNTALTVIVAAATNTTQRTGTINFLINGVVKTTATINQQGKFVPPTVDGVTTKATYGNWILGTVATSRQSFPAGTFDINGICVVLPSAITDDYQASISYMAYQTGPVVTGGSPTSYTVENQTYNIPAGSNFTASGTTYNGMMIVSPNPRLQINQVNGFTVTKQ